MQNRHWRPRISDHFARGPQAMSPMACFCVPISIHSLISARSRSIPILLGSDFPSDSERRAMPNWKANEFAFRPTTENRPVAMLSANDGGLRPQKNDVLDESLIQCSRFPLECRPGPAGLQYMVAG